MSAERFNTLRWRSQDGLQLYARDYPGAPGAEASARCPVICIPGLTRNSADFDQIATTVAASGRRVLAVDLRGRGKSHYATDPATYSVDTYALDVLELMRSQSISRAVFMGTSLGVWVTLTIAAKRADAVVAAVLNDAGPEAPKAALDRIARYAGIPVPPMTREDAAAYIERIGTAAYPRYTRADWVGMIDRMFRVREDGLLVLDYDPRIIRTLGPIKLWLLRPLLWRLYRKLATQRPTLILRGQLSDVLEARTARRMAAVSPTARLVEVEQVGHAPSLSEPDAVAAIMALLREVD